MKNLKTTASIVLLGGLLGCTQSQYAKKGTEIVRPLDDNTVILKYKGGEITAKDVKDRVDPALDDMRSRIIEQYRRNAENALLFKLLEAEAKKEGVNGPQELLMRVVQPKEVSDQEIAKFMKDNNLEKGFKNPQTGKMEKVNKEEIREWLKRESMQGQQQEYLTALRNKAEAKLLLEEPVIAVVESGKEPFFGTKDARVVIHEFSDFECPFCATKGKVVVDQIKSVYGDKVKIVYRNFPLVEKHPNAEPAALAALCAHKQGKFWEMHDKIFDNYRELSADKYAAWAKELGLKLDDFSKCQTAPETRKLLEEDLAAAQKMRVNSTPTFFVNGKKIEGAASFETFKSMIDQELLAR